MLNIRRSTVDDCELILDLIRQLAAYEKAPEQVTAGLRDIEENLFGKNAVARALIAEYGGTAVGFALYFNNYSTWTGKKGLYLEDIFVDPAYRAKGIGRAMMKELARIAQMEDCPRFEWSVLNWNKTAIAFYEGIGARAQSDWTVYRLEDKAIEKLAE